MKHLGFLFVVTFCLAFVTGCDETAKTKCIQEQKTAIEDGMDLEAKCRTIKGVTSCITSITSCSKEDGDKAFNQLQKELILDCDQSGIDKDGECQIFLNECERILEGRLNINESIQCKDMKNYLKCIQNTAVQVCDDINVIRKRTEDIMTREKIQCPDIWNNMCINKREKENCEIKFSGIVTVLGLTEQEEIKCRVARGLVRCLEKQAKCTLETIQVTVHRELETTDCSEYIDLCDRTMEENCSMTYGKSEKANCEKLKDLKECLRTKSICPQSHIHFTIRNVMQDQHIDCSDVNACIQVKEEQCLADALQNRVDTKEKQCWRFKAYKSCMVAAQCNDLYRDSKVTQVDKILNSPCGDGASTILASIGLTLLMAVFTNFWK